MKKEGKREPGIKSFQRGIKKLGISQLSELRKDEFITMELRVALEDTACKESHKKFATKVCLELENLKISVFSILGSIFIKKILIKDIIFLNHIHDLPKI